MGVQVLPAGLTLVGSPLLQASALKALQNFFVAIAACKAANTSYSSLMAALVGLGRQHVRKSHAIPFCL